MSTKFLSPGWRMPRNANQSKQSNYSMNFDATSSISLGTPSSGIGVFDKQVFSFSVWVKRERQNVNETIVNLFASSSNRGVELKFQYYAADGNYLCLQIGDVTNDSWYNNRVTNINNIMSLNVWYNITCTWDGTDSNIYINNVLRKNWTKNLTISYITSNQPAIGVAPNNSSKYLGEIDSFSYFDYVLSSSQITTLYGSSSTGIGNPMSLSPKPVAYYPLGESAGGFVGGSGTWLTENNAIGDYVFNFTGNKTVGLQDLNLGFNSTISYWVKNTSNTGNYMTNNGGTLINTGPYAGNEYYTFKPNNSAPTPNSASLTNSNINTYILSTDWVHWTAVRNGTGYELYANGQSIATATVANWSGYDTIVSGLGQNSLGMQGDGSNFLFWNTNLSSTEVETLYNYGSPIRTLANIPQNSNLKAWYKLDASEVYNSSTTEWSIDNNQNPSAYASSLDFVSSESDYIDCGNNSSFDITSELTLSAWIKKSSTTSNQFYISKRSSSGDGYQISSFSNKAAGMSIWIGGSRKDLLGTTNHVQDVWYHVVGTYDGTNMRVYLNGIEENSVAQTGAIDTTTAKLILGAYDGSGYSFDGKISNAQIFNTALPEIGSNSVETLYNNGTPLSDMSSFTSLVSWYKLNNTTTGIEDAKGSNNGTNNGATEYTGFVNTLVGDSSGMTQANLVQSDLQTVAPYSKYAIEFDYADSDYIDLTSDINLGSTFSFSVWLKTDHVNPSGIPQNTYVKNITGGTGFFKYYALFLAGLSDGRLSNYEAGGINLFTLSTNPLNDNIWHHCFVTFDGSTIKSYIDGSLNATIEGITNWTSNILKKIGRYDSSAIRYFDGILSNMAVWNSALTASQAREVYNEGLPSDLNIFSGPAPTAWWQLGENSSYAGGWIFANEIGSINGEGQNLTETNLVNGVGTTANGVSSGMSEGNLVGDAPYSTANAISSGMSVVSRVTGSGNTP